MTTNEHVASGPGETGGLPGANADPRTANLSEDEKADTVAGSGETATGMHDHDHDTDTATNG